MNTKMTREEAIEVYNGLINQKIREAFEFFTPELKESEDEKIRKALIEVAHDVAQERFFINRGTTLKDVLSYLEMQKPSFRQIHDGAMWDNGYQAGKNDAEKEINAQLIHWQEKTYEEMLKERFPDYDLKITFNDSAMEQKPAEWSEEDEEMRQAAIKVLADNTYISLANWLKFLRPSWKPSEEQLVTLLRAEGISPSEGAQSNFADIRKNEEKLNKVVAAINDMPLENELTDEQLDTYWRTCYNASLDCDMEKHKRGLWLER